MKVRNNKKKHFDPRISTFLGIKIDSSDENDNPSDSIRVKREFDSNTIDLSAPGFFFQCHARQLADANSE
jgi:hypothetical protein